MFELLKRDARNRVQYIHGQRLPSNPVQPCPGSGLTAVQQIEKLPTNCSPLAHQGSLTVLCVRHRDEPLFLLRLARLAADVVGSGS
jgi:hypothetical protein